jgi:D-alanyl-D-alanine carboxypeptidase
MNKDIVKLNGSKWMWIFKNTTLNIFVCFFTFFSFAYLPSLQARKSASIAICAETGRVLHSSNPDAITHPASLTKMMTLYLTFKALRSGKLKMDQKLPISKFATQQEPCNLWLKRGGTITVRQAIMGLITKSANDASVVLAEALGKGSEKQFAKQMTDQARNLGMRHTVFKNATGLPNRQQVTTAREMAVLSQALYKHFPEYYKLFKEKTFNFKGTVHENHNKLLGKVQGVDGIKTGFTNWSGYNLAASMVRNNKRIIAVVLGGATRHARDKQMVSLLESTHAKFKDKILPQISVRYAGGGDSIGNLIGGIHPSSTPSKKPKVQKAMYLSHKGKPKTLEKKYKSLDEVFAVLNPSVQKVRPTRGKKRKRA